MHLVFCSQEYPPESSRVGIGTQTYAKAHAFAAKGYEVSVISHGDGEERIDYLDGKVRVTRIPSPDVRLDINSDLSRWITYSTEVSATIGSIHKERPIDLVEFPEWACEGLIHLLNQTEWSHIPTVIQLHGPVVMFAKAMGWPLVDSEMFRLGAAIEGTCLRLADGIYSSSRCSADWCAREYGLNGSQIPVIHTGVDTSKFRPGRAARNAFPTVAFVGRISGVKGIEDLTRACSELVSELPDLRLRILGRGDESYIAHLQGIAERAGADSLLDFGGFVEHDELPVELCKAHLMAVPSTHEPGPGLVYIESMACGVPVVACSNAGASEVVDSGSTGILVEPNNGQDLKSAIRLLLKDSFASNQFGKRARQNVVHNASTEICIQRIEDFYMSVLAK